TPTSLSPFTIPFHLPIPPPPISPLFPYTTLFRSHLHLLGERGRIGLLTRLLQDLARDAVHLVDGLDHVHRDADRDHQQDEPHLRSEEHTSELQSLTNLVCRLLLEKKKTSEHHMLT